MAGGWFYRAVLTLFTETTGMPPGKLKKKYF